LAQAGADELVKTSIDGGINFFDTADNYTEGESEKILGQSLKNLKIARQDVVIATKVYSRVGPGRNDIGASRGHIMDGVEASLRRLQTDHIDLYQIHANDSVTPVEETIRALDTLVQQGKVRYIGYSNWQAWKIAKALGISEFRNLARFDTLQAYYSIGGRDLEREIVPCWNPKRLACSCGVRLPAACFRASSVGRTRNPRIRAALSTTFPSWTKIGLGRSST
jgi:aryl-alcohol dehydrogenase-like predicted oxidoreductase